MSNDFELPDDFDPFAGEADEQAVLDTSTQEEVKEYEPKKEEQKEPEKPKYNSLELLQIFDTIMFEGEYSEKIQLNPKFHIVLRSRTMKESLEVTRRIDKANFGTPQAVMQHIAAMNLAYSLININGKDYKEMPPLREANTPKTTKVRLDVIQDLPGAMVGRLTEVLYKFDEKISAAMEEGIKNF